MAVTLWNREQAEAACRHAAHIKLTLQEHPVSPVNPQGRGNLATEAFIAGAGYFYNPHRDWWEVPRHGESWNAFYWRMKAEADVLPCAAPKG
jgi:hypothetical protein